MTFEEIEEGMVFDQSTPPRFLFIDEKHEDAVSIFGIDLGVSPGDPEWYNVTDEYDWEDFFQDAELVEDIVIKRQVFKELFNEI